MKPSLIFWTITLGAWCPWHILPTSNKLFAAPFGNLFIYKSASPKSSSAPVKVKETAITNTT
jgi:hypothetical protein